MFELLNFNVCRGVEQFLFLFFECSTFSFWCSSKYRFICSVAKVGIMSVCIDTNQIDKALYLINYARNTHTGLADGGKVLSH